MGKAESTDGYSSKTKVKAEHSELLINLGSRIEEIRKEKDIGVKQLCDEVGISRTTYYRITKGVVYFNTENIFKICDQLGVEITFGIQVKSDQ